VKFVIIPFKKHYLSEAPVSFLWTHFGFWGHILKLMGQGVDNSPVSCYWQHDEPKSMGHSHTFPIDISDPIMIKAYALMLCQKLAERLRNEGKSAYTVALTVRNSDFKTFCYRKTPGNLIKGGVTKPLSQTQINH
jgi:DNA polymerase-4